MHPKIAKTPSKYRADIDGLRAIAIISVVAYHAGFPGFSGGFVGVDIFFVISGFLITSLLFGESVATGRINLGAFFARRVRRLMPAGLLVLATTLVLGALFLPPVSDEVRALARSALAMTYFGSNFFFFQQTGGYFDAPSFSFPLLHTWSLAVEEQYYLIWPLLMLLVFRLSGGKRTESAMRSRVLWMLWAMVIASLTLCVWATPTHHNFAFFLLPTRVWEFAIGAIVGVAGVAFHARLRNWGEAMAVLGLAAIICSVVALDHGTPFPGWAAILPVFGSALLIAGTTANENGLVRRMLSLKPMVFIGLLSYSWYLWHWPLLSIYRIYNLGDQDLAANASLVLLALLLAWVTFVWVEQPIRMRRPWFFGKVRPTLFAGAGICLLSLVMATGLYAWHKHEKSSPAYQEVLRAQADFSPYQRACLLPHDKPVDELTRLTCIFGPDNEHPKIMLWGDSHAAHMMATLKESYGGLSVYQLTTPGCVPVIGYESQTPRPLKFCTEFNQHVLKEVSEMKRKGLEGVVISARWPSYLWRQSIPVSEQLLGIAQEDAQKIAEARMQMQASFDATLTMLERAGVRILVLAPTPVLVYSAPQCVAMRGGAFCDVPRKLNDTILSETTAALAEVVGRHPNVRLAQLMEYFCDAHTCYAARDGKILYVDDDHITATTARDLARYLKDDFDWLREPKGSGA